MEAIQRVMVVQYTGSIESYNELITNLKLDRDNYHVMFLDDKYQSTNLFTGIIHIHCFKKQTCQYFGLTLRPHDHYQFDIV